MSRAGSQVDTRSVVFTDLVRSTELRVRLGEEAAEAIRRTHDALVGEAVADHGGTVVKGLGDGAMTTFGSAAEAVAAVVAIQQAVELHALREPERAFSLRVGVSVGDVTLDDADVFGVPVVEASRLCEAATGGEILAAELVRALSRGRGGFVFEPMGSLELKGLPEPVPVCRVVWESLLDAVVGDTPSLPAALMGVGATRYVGRPDLLACLEEHWRAATGGGCRTVLLAGEPGIGKTRTAAELARVAHAQGAVVLYGRCDEELGAPYQPFVEALDWFTTQLTTPELGRFPGEVSRLLPELRERVSGVPAPVPSDPRSEEHRLLEGVASWLTRASEAGGLVLVVDDLHWATKPTLLMLLHVMRAAADSNNARLFLVGTYRDTDIDRRHPLAGVLAELRRVPGVERIAVENLTAAEVLSLIEVSAGHELDENGRRLAAIVHEETEGNPFFVGEVLRHLVETELVRREGDRWVVADLGHVAVPEGVRDVIGRRLSLLSQSANDVLAVAAVIGRTVGLDVLVSVSNATEDEVLDALDEAVRARLIEETGPDEFRFSHSLVRSTLYEELSVTRRRRLHRRVTDAIEKLHPDDVSALAYHSVEAGPDGADDLTRAVGYVLAAAERAQQMRALAEAESQYRLALELLADGPAEPAQEIAAQCGVGECQRDQGDPAYRQTLLDAARRARAGDDVSLLVRAVLANTRGMASVVGDVDEERVELIEAALAAVGSEPSAERARLLAHLADELTFAGDDDRRLTLADEAEALARRLDDRRVLAQVLVQTGFAAYANTRWRAFKDRQREGVELADETGDPALRVLARFWWSGAMLMAGDIAAVDRVTDEMLTIAADASPTVRWMSTALSVRMLVLHGHLDEATRRNDEALALGQAVGAVDAPSWWAATGFQIPWSRGELPPDWRETSRAFADAYPRTKIWRGAHAFGLAEAGRHDEARDVVSRYGLDPFTLDSEPWPLHLSMMLAMVAWHVRDPELAHRTAQMLRPYRGCWAHYYVGSIGPVARALGICALTLGESDDAVLFLDEALRAVTTSGCEGLAPRVRLELAEALVARAAIGDDRWAAELLADVRASAIQMDAPTLVERAERLAARASSRR